MLQRHVCLQALDGVPLTELLGPGITAQLSPGEWLRRGITGSASFNGGVEITGRDEICSSGGVHGTPLSSHPRPPPHTPTRTYLELP